TPVVLAGTRRSRMHRVPWPVVERTVVHFDGDEYRLVREPPSLAATNSKGERWEVGRYGEAEESDLLVALTPGAETYYDARAYHGRAFTECDLAAAVVVACLSGHPDADKGRAGTALTAVWSHHLAVVGGEAPRNVAKTYAPTETKTVSRHVQHMAAIG